MFPGAEALGFVVTFNPGSIVGPGSINGLRRMSLQEACEVLRIAGRIPKHGRVVCVDTLQAVHHN